MSVIKKRVALSTMLLMIAVNVFAIPMNTEAASNILVLVDGMPVRFDVQPVIINDRTMVPFAAIGTALGVSATTWDDATKTVTMYLNDDYVLLKIGNPTMNYGKFTIDSTGGFRFTTQQSLELDVAPTIVNSRTLVPLAALARGLGAGVGWEPATRTVTITSPVRAVPVPLPAPTPTPTPAPTSEPVPSEAPFRDTFYFSTLSASRIQSMYDSGESFILLYYDSTMPRAGEFLPIIKRAAEFMEYDIYAVDSASEAFNSRRIPFIYDVTSRSVLESYSPVLFLIYGKGDVQAYRYERLIKNSDANTERNLIDMIGTFAYYTKPLESEPSEPEKNLTWYWTDIDQSLAATRYNRNDEFILVVYDSVNGNDKSLMLHKEAAYDARKNVLAIDINNIERSSHWIRRYVDEAPGTPVILVVSGREDVREYRRNDLEDIIAVFTGS